MTNPTKICTICDYEIFRSQDTKRDIRYCALCADYILSELKSMTPPIYQKATHYIEGMFSQRNKEIDALMVMRYS